MVHTTKAEMVRSALAAVPSGKNPELRDWIKQTYGSEMTLSQIGAYKAAERAKEKPKAEKSADLGNILKVHEYAKSVGGILDLKKQVESLAALADEVGGLAHLLAIVTLLATVGEDTISRFEAGN